MAVAQKLDWWWTHLYVVAVRAAINNLIRQEAKNTREGPHLLVIDRTNARTDCDAVEIFESARRLGSQDRWKLFHTASFFMVF